jgi:hypothetical protein
MPRRELFWRFLERGTQSLEDLSQEFEHFLLVVLPTSTSPLRYIHNHNKPKTAHRCRGYRREEITLTTDILASAVILHGTPAPREICSICGEVVGKADVFQCECGEGEAIDHSIAFSGMMVLQRTMVLRPPSSAQTVLLGTISDVSQQLEICVSLYVIIAR